MKKRKSPKADPQAGAFAGLNLLLGVTGGIAAYKAAILLRRLREQGATLRVMMTRNATRFVGEVTFEALSGHPVGLDVFGRSETPEGGVYHINWADWPDFAVLAPATANSIGKFANGIADDFVSTMLLALPCPVLVAPAMNDVMWASAAVQKNIEILKSRGVRIAEPGSGYLACERVGEGRMAEPDEIVDVLRTMLPNRPYTGLRVLVTAGGTEEDLDPARCITNRSSGKMGFAIADVARRMGADVRLIAARTTAQPPADLPVVRVRSASDMAIALEESYPHCDILIMAAAVSDFRPEAVSDVKLRRDAAPELKLSRVPDILANLAGKERNGRTLVGFALETGELVSKTEAKLKKKDVDLMVGNDPTEEETGFGSDTNRVVLAGRDGVTTATELLPKTEIARLVLERALEIHRAGRTDRNGGSS